MTTSATVSQTDAKRKHVGLIALLSAGFILTGFPTILVGPILPTFISAKQYKQIPREINPTPIAR